MCALAGRTAGSPREGGYAAHRLARLPCPPRPSEAQQSREVLGHKSPRLSGARAGGPARAPVPRAAGARRRARLLTEREERGGRSPAGLKKRRASSLPACSPGTGLLSHPRETPRGTGAREAAESESCFTVQRQNPALPYRGGSEVTVIPLHPADYRALKWLHRPISGGLIFCCTPQAGS